jgi:hypothetical protein
VEVHLVGRQPDAVEDHVAPFDSCAHGLRIGGIRDLLLDVEVGEGLLQVLGTPRQNANLRSAGDKLASEVDPGGSGGANDGGVDGIDR